MIEEQKLLDEVENMASLLFSDEDISLITGVSTSDLLTEKFATCIRRGRLLREARLRQSILSLAENGSSPAQGLAVEFLNTLKRDQV